jgi:hypothetical protein
MVVSFIVRLPLGSCFVVAVSLIKLINRIRFYGVSFCGKFTAQNAFFTVAVSMHRICYYGSKLRKLICVFALV